MAVLGKLGTSAFWGACRTCQGEPAEADGEETPEGHVVRFEPGTQRVVGLTVINARWLLERDGRLVVTVTETVEASVADFAPALATA